MAWNLDKPAEAVENPDAIREVLSERSERDRQILREIATRVIEDRVAELGELAATASISSQELMGITVDLNHSVNRRGGPMVLVLSRPLETERAEGTSSFDHHALTMA
jgi:cell division ATPase FtsA